NPRLEHFEGIERYEVDPGWRIEAEFTPAEAGTSIEIENVIGQIIDWDVAGTLSFTHEGEHVQMVALGTGSRLFIPFADGTSGTETYPAGRFVYIDRPGSGEKAILDFNYSYNPPCAINPHTTCPLPPAQNRLSFPIRAGELNFDMYEKEES
ncbi:DUF1684 domain-containing protein, partial [Balneolaceae bacterium ANBcel3]|nr:DUF1684 domain-containing protein [Balneolaceae bacterium ANBcel3]